MWKEVLLAIVAVAALIFVISHSHKLLPTKHDDDDQPFGF